MTRIAPAAFTLSPSEMPRATLNEREVRTALTRANVDPKQHESIVALLRRTMNDYALSVLVEQLGATPAEVRAYSEQLGSAVRQMRSLTVGSESKVGKALFDRAYIQGSLPIGFADELNGILARLVSGLMASAAHVAEAKTTSGKMAQAARHRKLAHAMLLHFADAGWPIDLKSSKGLLCQLFVICIEAVGESQARPQRVFNDVAKRIIAGEAVH